MADIGLRAVMEMTGFTAGINKYNQMMGGASSNTEKHAGLMTKAMAGIGTAASALLGFWRQRSRPSGLSSGRAAKILTRQPYILIATVIYATILVLLWRQIPISLSSQA